MIVVMGLLSRRYPVRMMLLYPRVIVLHPPGSVVPLMMLVVSAHPRRRYVCVSWWPGVSVRGRRSVSVGRRLRVVRMSAAIKACLKRHRSKYENQHFEGRENFAPHRFYPHPRQGASRMPTKESRESRGLHESRECGYLKFSGRYSKRCKPQEYLRRVRITADRKDSFTARPAFCTVGVTGPRSSVLGPPPHGGSNDAR